MKFSMEFHGNSIFYIFHGKSFSWKLFQLFHRIPWNSMETAFFIEFNGKRFPWNSMENIPWNSMEFHAQYQTEFHGIPWKKFHGIPWNSMEFHGVILHGFVMKLNLYTTFNGQFIKWNGKMSFQARLLAKLLENNLLCRPKHLMNCFSQIKITCASVYLLLSLFLALVCLAF